MFVVGIKKCIRKIREIKLIGIGPILFKV